MSTKELPKAYDAAKVEERLYQLWEKSGYFNPDNLPGKRTEVFSVAMPPPNVTGILHLGHALENSLLDVAVRYQRLRGKKTLLLPGTDHAAVATQARVEDGLKKQGVTNPRQELGREKLLKVIREYAEKSKATILQQIRKLGTSCDWSRLAYTFDETRSAAVNELFVRMYNDGLIYRGYRVVNWSVKGQSTCSDDELVYVDLPTKIYTFKYSQNFPIPIATTRPETKLGDTAVAVNPKDARYKEYIGKKFVVEVGAAKPLTITIIADIAVDSKYGTGAVGVTPAHSAVDFEMYQKNKEIGLIQVIGADGKMTLAAGEAYAGLPVLETREKFVSWLKANNLFIKEEKASHKVGTSDRFGDVVEAIPMEQWFVDVNKKITGRNKSLKELMRQAVTTGHQGKKDQKIHITPERFKDTYLQWIDNLRDWCISRQIWWGHRVPVWYCVGEGSCQLDCKKPIVALTPPSKCPICHSKNLRQDEDTLDTWFSSGAWTFSTLGWPTSVTTAAKAMVVKKATAGKPVKIKDLKIFHPTSWMQMGYEILFFWMARMILMSTYALDEIPFREVYIHGMLRDKDGRKFAKSLGNGLDPLEIIKQYGTDALRLSLLKGITPGNDSRFYLEKVAGARNFVNKLWNISRFILITVTKVKIITRTPVAKTLADEWILSQLNKLVGEVTLEMEKYNFSAAAELLLAFTWTDLADWYLEITKVEKNKDEILLYILHNLLRLWHPFIPFITEEIWWQFSASSLDKDLLMVQDWPEATKESSGAARQNFLVVQEVVKSIRNLRAENNIVPTQKIKVVISAGKQEKLLTEQKTIIKALVKAGDLQILAKADRPAQSVGLMVGEVAVYLPLAGVIDIFGEKVRTQKEIQQTKIYRQGLEGKLAKPEFTDRAPQDVVDKEREKLVQVQEKLVKLEEHLKSLE